MVTMKMSPSPNLLPDAFINAIDIVLVKPAVPEGFSTLQTPSSPPHIVTIVSSNSSLAALGSPFAQLNAEISESTNHDAEFKNIVSNARTQPDV